MRRKLSVKKENNKRMLSVCSLTAFLDPASVPLFLAGGGRWTIFWGMNFFSSTLRRARERINFWWARACARIF